MRHWRTALLLAVAATAACHKTPSGPTTGDSVPISDLDNAIAENAVMNVDEPAAPAGND